MLEASMAEKRSFLVLFLCCFGYAKPLTGFRPFQRSCYFCGYEDAIFRPFVLMRGTSLSLAGSEVSRVTLRTTLFFRLSCFFFFFYISFSV